MLNPHLIQEVIYFYKKWVEWGQFCHVICSLQIP